MNTKPKVLILGGNGFIGSNLSRHFKNAGWETWVLTRPSSAKSTYFGKPDQIIYCDYTDTTRLEEVFDQTQFSLVVHLISTVIPATNFKQFYHDMDVNLSATMRLLDIMERKGVNRMLYFSSGGTVYGNNGRVINDEFAPEAPINFYGWHKLAMEKYIRICHRNYGLEYLIIRPSNPYGYNQNLYGRQGLIAVSLGKILKKEPITVWGDGNTIRDYIFIDDFCEACIKLLHNNIWNETFNIGSGLGGSIKEVLSHIQHVTQIDFEVQYEPARKVDIPANILDTTKLKHAISWRPDTSLPEGIGKMWTWINETTQIQGQ